MASNIKADAHNDNKGTSGKNKIRKSNLDKKSIDNNPNNPNYKARKN